LVGVLRGLALDARELLLDSGLDLGGNALPVRDSPHEGSRYSKPLGNPGVQTAVQLAFQTDVRRHRTPFRRISAGRRECVTGQTLFEVALFVSHERLCDAAHDHRSAASAGRLDEAAILLLQQFAAEEIPLLSQQASLLAGISAARASGKYFCA
jgi:hypothetical protein